MRCRRKRKISNQFLYFWGNPLLTVTCHKKTIPLIKCPALQSIGKTKRPVFNLDPVLRTPKAMWACITCSSGCRLTLLYTWQVSFCVLFVNIPKDTRWYANMTYLSSHRRIYLPWVPDVYYVSYCSKSAHIWHMQQRYFLQRSQRSLIPSLWSFCRAQHLSWAVAICPSLPRSTTKFLFFVFLAFQVMTCKRLHPRTRTEWWADHQWW